MLKMKYLPEKHPRKSEIAAREERTQKKRPKRRIFRLKNTVLCPSQEIDTTIVPETRVPDVRLSILAVSCVVTSVRWEPRSISTKMTQTVNFVVFLFDVD